MDEDLEIHQQVKLFLKFLQLPWKTSSPTIAKKLLSLILSGSFYRARFFCCCSALVPPVPTCGLRPQVSVEPQDFNWAPFDQTVALKFFDGE